MTDFQQSGGPSRWRWLQELLRRFRIRQDASPAALPMLGADAVPQWPSRQQLKYFPDLLSPTEDWVIRLAAILLLASLIVIGVRGYQQHVVRLPRPGGSYSEALVGSPKFINPVLAYANDVDLDLTQLIFRGLYQTNENGEVVPALADHTEVSEDGKTYVITLRQNSVWHDGEPITANDVAFTYGIMADPEYQSPHLAAFKNLSVEVIDDYTIKITLEKPFAPLLSSLTVGIVPQHIWNDVPPSSFSLAEYNLKPIGSGPFAFDSLTKDRRGTMKSYRLVRFDKYNGDRPYLDEIAFQFYQSKDELLAAIRRNQADGINYVTGEMRQDVEKRGLVLQPLHLSQYTAVFFNQRNPLLKERVIRQSLERATDADQIIRDALGGAGEPIHTPILPGYLGHNPAVGGLAYDAQAAGKMLDDAGWSLFAGETVRKKNGKELQFTLTTVDRPEYIKTAELLRDFWAKIGVGLEIRLFSSNDIIKKVIKPRDYEALLFGEIVGADPDPYPFWHSSQSYDPGLNLAIFFNKQVDQLLEEARQSNDPEQRRLKYLQFQNILADEEPAIFLYNPYYTYALPKKIKGFTVSRITVPSDRFVGVERWFIKTRRGWK